MTGQGTASSWLMKDGAIIIFRGNLSTFLGLCNYIPLAVNKITLATQIPRCSALRVPFKIPRFMCPRQDKRPADSEESRGAPNDVIMSPVPCTRFSGGWDLTCLLKASGMVNVLAIQQNVLTTCVGILWAIESRRERY